MHKQKRIVFIVLATIALCTLLLLPYIFSYAKGSEFYGHFLNKQAPSFELFDVEGASHQLEKHRGRFVFLYFGYLHCDEVCHNQVGVMFNLDRQTAEDDIDFIFITMDPKRDSAQMLKTYFNHLGPNFYALRSETIKDVQSLANRYNAAFYPDKNWTTSEDYEINHPGTLYLIDKTGEIKLIYPNMHLRYDFIIKDLNKLRTLESHQPT